MLMLSVFVEAVGLLTYMHLLLCIFLSALEGRHVQCAVVIALFCFIVSRNDLWEMEVSSMSSVTTKHKIILLYLIDQINLNKRLYINISVVWNL